MRLVIENVLSSVTVLVLAGIWRSAHQWAKSIETRLRALEDRQIETRDAIKTGRRRGTM